MIKKMLCDDEIRPSKSLWASPVILVEKKNNKKQRDEFIGG